MAKRKSTTPPPATPHTPTLRCKVGDLAYLIDPDDAPNFGRAELYLGKRSKASAEEAAHV